MTKKKGFLEILSENKLIHTIFSILLGFLFGAVVLAVMGLSPLQAYGKLVDSVSSVKGFSYVVVYSVPYIMTGLSVAFSFKTGVFNIGAEGQYVVGSMAAAVTSILLPNLPSWVLIPLCFLAAMLAGALWSAIVAVLKIKWGINEVLSMIMFNWIAYYLSNFCVLIPAIHSDGSAEATKNVADNASLLLSKDFIKSAGLANTANWGILVAITAVILIWFIIEKTTLGYSLKSVGANKSAAEYGGINVNRSILTALAISGALAGLAGALQLMGMGKRISFFTSQEGFGFAGIVVALIGCTNPFGVFLAGLFYGALMYGGGKLNLVGAPTQLISVVVGTVVFFIAISVIFRYLKYLKRKPKPKQKETGKEAAQK